MTRDPDPSAPSFARRATIFAIAAAVGAGVTVLVMLLYANILTRKAEAKNKVLRIADVDETTIDAAVWGQNFPCLLYTSPSPRDS